MLISAFLGAIVGDGLSFWLGYRYHREILQRWPLNRYPELIARSEAFFERHGGKSVFLARFTPGVRAFIPLVAGMLQMPARRFYYANIFSAFVWAPSHILPGELVSSARLMHLIIARRHLQESSGLAAGRPFLQSSRSWIGRNTSVTGQQNLTIPNGG
ncbi:MULTISPECIES: DedA family protein [Mesorhizobium]|uniref:DedA family protein n=1 Tax=Mesorhizobium TaxID=68287 RepID=UPI001FE3FBE5|nr:MULTISPECIES: DedA family protein [Mesorhizobium]